MLLGITFVSFLFIAGYIVFYVGGSVFFDWPLPEAAEVCLRGQHARVRNKFGKLATIGPVVLFTAISLLLDYLMVVFIRKNTFPTTTTGPQNCKGYSLVYLL